MTSLGCNKTNKLNEAQYIENLLPRVKKLNAIKYYERSVDEKLVVKIIQASLHAYINSSPASGIYIIRITYQFEDQ